MHAFIIFIAKMNCCWSSSVRKIKEGAFLPRMELAVNADGCTVIGFNRYTTFQLASMKKSSYYCHSIATVQRIKYNWITLPLLSQPRTRWSTQVSCPVVMTLNQYIVFLLNIAQNER